MRSADSYRGARRSLVKELGTTWSDQFKYQMKPKEEPQPEPPKPELKKIVEEFKRRI